MPDHKRSAPRPRSLMFLTVYYAAVLAGLAAMRVPGGGPIALATYYLLLPLGAAALWRWTAGEWTSWGALSVGVRLELATIGAGAGVAVLSVATLLAHAAGWLTLERLPGIGALIGLAAQQALVAGIEEVAFRGVIQRLLAAHWGAPRGLLVAGALFGAFHLPNIAEQGVPGRLVPITLFNLTLMGWVFGAAYQRAGNLALPFGLHFGWNMVSYSVEDWSGARFHAPASWIGSPTWFPESGLMAGFALLALAGILTLILPAHRRRLDYPPAT